jgi:polynucleotide 5'-kinase involved in rRNA processing
MTPVMLRQLWSLIETTQATLLVTLDDATLVQWLLKQLKMNSALNVKETDLLDEYIQSRLSLIRDLAQQRLAPERL